MHVWLSELPARGTVLQAELDAKGNRGSGYRVESGSHILRGVGRLALTRIANGVHRAGDGAVKIVGASEHAFDGDSTET